MFPKPASPRDHLAGRILLNLGQAGRWGGAFEQDVA